MNEEGIKHFLTEIGVEGIVVDGGWVKCSCPLAKFTHKKGTDNTPSFGVHIEDNKQSRYNCFSCGSSGKLIKLLHSLWLARGEYPYALSKILLAYEEQGEEPDDIESLLYGTARDKYTKKSRKDIHAAIPSKDLKWFPKVGNKKDEGARIARKWLMEERRISMKALSFFGIRCQYNPMTGRVGILMPIISRDDGTSILDIYVRYTDSGGFWRFNNEMLGSNVKYSAADLMFGNHQYDVRRPCMFFEAPLDAMSCFTFGYENVLGHNGGPKNAHKKVMQLFRTVILGYDADTAGDKFTKKALRMLGEDQTVYKLDWSIAGVKDCGELKSKQDFRLVLKKAKLLRGRRRPS